MAQFSIGRLSKLTDTKVPTIRYYEQIGLLSEPERNDGNQRRYNHAQLSQLQFVRHCRQLGFGLDEIRQLMALQQLPQQQEQVQLIANQHLSLVQTKLQQLQKLEQELRRLVSCCASGQPHQCRILDVLADHQLCGTEHQCVDVKSAG